MWEILVLTPSGSSSTTTSSGSNQAMFTPYGFTTYVTHLRCHAKCDPGCSTYSAYEAWVGNYENANRVRELFQEAGIQVLLHQHGPNCYRIRVGSCYKYQFRLHRLNELALGNNCFITLDMIWEALSLLVA
jgi:hypothetical protein